MQAKNAGVSIYPIIIACLVLTVLGLYIYVERERVSVRIPSKTRDFFFELKFLAVHLCGTGTNTFPRVLQPTVPRSGSSFSRRLVENLTGIATEAVYEEGGTFSNRTQASGRECGLTGDCDRVHRSYGNELVLIKTHFPFMQPEFDEKDCVSKILMTVRHPLDNYFALALTSGKGKTIQTLQFRDNMNFEKYFDLWEAHHNYWHAFASRMNVPLLQYRYEDLCQHPEIVMKKVSRFLSVQFKGDYNHSSKFNDCFLRNRKYPKSASLISQHDLDVLAESTSYLLDLFGYKEHLRIDSLMLDNLNS